MTKIIVNGKEHNFEKYMIGYDDVFKIVYGDKPGPLLSVTHSWDDPKSKDWKREGTLRPKSYPISVKEGMNISAYHTGNA